MPKLATQLTDAACRMARPRENSYTMPSGRGLHLNVLPTGIKQWVVRFRTPEGKRGAKVIGVYPEMGVAAAHVAAEQLAQRVRTGQPAEGMYDHKRAAKRALTQEQEDAERAAADAYAHSFTVLSEAWLEDRKPGWSKATYNKNLFIVQDRLQPALGAMDMRTLSSKDVAPILRKIFDSAPTVATKARQCLNGIVDYCILLGVRGDDQVLRLKGALPKYEGGHIPAEVQQKGLGPLMRAILAYDGLIVRAALLMCAYTSSRPGMVVAARWDEIDLDAGEWLIPAAKMKMRADHLVSLPRQAVELLQEMRQLSQGPYVFPGVGKRGNPHLHRDALSKALRDMGFQGKHAPHGFRSTLRTVAREKLKIDVDVLEAQLAHAKKDSVQKAYDRTRFEEERRNVMQTWADFLHQQAEGAKIIDYRRA